MATHDWGFPSWNVTLQPHQQGFPFYRVDMGKLDRKETLKKILNLLKMDSMFTLQLLNFCYDFLNRTLPAYLHNMFFFYYNQ